MNERKQRILLVEDDPHLVLTLRDFLSFEGYDVATAADGEQGLAQARTCPPDLIILDISMPGMGGLGFLNQIKGADGRPRYPVMVFTARSAMKEFFDTLPIDGFVEKPCERAELLARIRSALRSRSPDAGRTVHEAGDLRVDLARHAVTRAGRDVRLTPKEFSLLSLLVRHAGRVLTHRQILGEVWGPGHAEDVQYLRVYIGQLRDKLGDDAASPKLIANEPGIGYRLLA